jgi:hypothetical protein
VGLSAKVHGCLRKMSGDAVYQEACASPAEEELSGNLITASCERGQISGASGYRCNNGKQFSEGPDIPAVEASR